MGYDLHITRAPEWIDSGSHPITLRDWNAYVVSDEQICHDPDNSAEDYLFDGHLKEPWPLWWSDGEIYTKNPDGQTIDKLCQIAAALGAVVQGDDGEVYREGTDYKGAPFEESKVVLASSTTRAVGLFAAVRAIFKR